MRRVLASATAWLLVVVTVVGCSSTKAATPAELGTTLEQVALKQSDLAYGMSVGPVAHGDQVAGQVTLDNCGFHFTTEAHRVARRQYLLQDAALPGVRLSNELVGYDTPANASDALRQWTASAATCPSKPVHSVVAGVPDLLMKVSRNDSAVAMLPVHENALTIESGTASGQGTLYNVTVIQVHGRILDAVALVSTSPVDTQAVNATVQLAIVTGKRLDTVT